MMRQLVLQPVAGDRGDRAVAPLGAGVGQGAEPVEGVVRVGEPRRHHPADRDPVAAALGDLGGGPQRLGAVGEVAGEVGRRARARPRRAGPARPRVERRERGVAVDGAEQPVAGPVLRVRHDDRVGDHAREAEPAGRGEYGVALLAGLQLGVEIARAARAEDAVEEGGVSERRMRPSRSAASWVESSGGTERESPGYAPFAEPALERRPPLPCGFTPAQWIRVIARQSAAHPGSSVASAIASSPPATRWAPRMGRMPAASRRAGTRPRRTRRWCRCRRA